MAPSSSTTNDRRGRRNNMTATFASALKRGRAFLTPTSSSQTVPTLNNGFSKAPEELLFPKVDPAVDGEDCDRDCESCSIRYPAKFSIDEDDKLYGHVNAWATHMLVATGKTDWVRDVSDEKGSVMQAVRDCGVEPSNGKLMLSASNMPLPHDHHSPWDPTSILLLPSFTIIENVSPPTVPELITRHINPAPTSTTPFPPSSSPPPSNPLPTTFINGPTPPLPTSTLSLSTPFTTRPCPHKYLILLCSQKTRDARCGQSAPLLRREFERHLRPLGLYRDLQDERPGGVGIYFISHVGGHKYSANLMIYRRGDVVAGGADGESVEEGRDQVVDAGGELEGKPNDGSNGVITSNYNDPPNSQTPVNGDTHTNKDNSKNPPMGEGEANQCIWLARVRPEDCEGIVKYTILKGKVVKPHRQLRGGFDRQRGLVSW
ncbi:MAG: hypothetical protein Q9168_007149 [Polycauliona sp. 1 TL-2023]